jgi:hypothetical protein
MDTDGDDAVDFDEFAVAVARPSKVEQWTSGIPVERLLASALSPVVLAHAGSGGGGGGAGGGGDVMLALSRYFMTTCDQLAVGCRVIPGVLEIVSTGPCHGSLLPRCRCCHCHHCIEYRQPPPIANTKLHFLAKGVDGGISVRRSWFSKV